MHCRCQAAAPLTTVNTISSPLTVVTVKCSLLLMATPLRVEKVPVIKEAFTMSNALPTVGVYPLARLIFNVPHAGRPADIEFRCQ